MSDVAPRPLTTPEVATLEFLLTADVPGIEELRAQIPNVRVVGMCDCGCATIDLMPDRRRATRAQSFMTATNPVVEAMSRPEAPAHPAELLLHVQDGWISELEIVYYADNQRAVFPSIETWGLPTAGAKPPPPGTLAER